MDEFNLYNINHNEVQSWTDTVKLFINAQDDEGDTLLHYAVRKADVDFIFYLLERGAVLSANKKGLTALLEAYVYGPVFYQGKEIKLATEITKFITQKNSIKKIIIQKSIKANKQEQKQLDKLVNNFIKYLRKNYLDRNIFLRFLARHTKRANALIDATQNCSSIKEFKGLLDNQRNLFTKKILVQPLPHNRIIDKQWSESLKNKPSNANNSQFYKTINTFVVEQFSSEVNRKNYTNNVRVPQSQCFSKS